MRNADSIRTPQSEIRNAEEDGTVTVDEFTRTLSSSAPPSNVRPALLALWHDARGDWTEAHRIAQDIEDVTGAWIHAYLHRKEGDLGNAGYWYRRAEQPIAVDSLDAEWGRIVASLLA
jgi:hypothetical protein